MINIPAEVIPQRFLESPRRVRLRHHHVVLEAPLADVAQQLLQLGHARDGPTLELFRYAELADEVERVVNRPGFGHIAFSVANVREAHEEVLAHGGTALGEIVTLATATGARVTWCYVRDPEGNIIELQSWS